MRFVSKIADTFADVLAKAIVRQGKAAGVGVALGVGGMGWAGLTELGSRHKQLRAMKGWVATCVSRRATDLSALPLKLYKATSRDREAWDQIPEHPVLDLMDRPHPQFTGPQLRYLLQTHYDLTGMSFALVLDNALGVPAMLVPLLPDHLVEILPSNDARQLIKAFRFRDDQGKQWDLPPELVYYRRRPSTISLIYGASVIQEQAEAYDIDLAQRTYQRQTLQNRARPDVALRTDQRLTEDDAKRILSRFRAKYAGPQNAGEPIVLDGGLDVKQLSFTNKDLMFLELTGWTRDNILAAYGMPAAKLGLVEDVNRANGQAVDITYRRDTIGPLAAAEGYDLTGGLAHRYDPNLWLEPENAVPEDDDSVHKRGMNELDHGVTTINEWRERQGLDPVPWGDVPLLPATTMPLTQRPARGDSGGAQQMAVPVAVIKSDDPDALDEAEFAQFAASVDRWAVRMAGQIQPVFARQQLEVVRRLEAAWPRLEARFAGWSRAKVAKALKKDAVDLEPVFADWGAWGDELFAAGWERVMPAVLLEAGQEALTSIGAGVVFNLQDERVLGWLAENAATAAKVNDYTRERLRSALLEAAANGETLAQATGRVAEIFDWCANGRAGTITRTEVANARRWGTHQGFVQSGAPLVKEWRREPGARPSHAAAGARYGTGKGIPLDKPFNVGGCKGQTPGHTGCAREDINCRCWARYVPAPEGRAAAPANGLAEIPPAKAYTLEDCREA